MPRRARHYLSGMPYHIVQRGNNREACFIEPENYQFYLELWQHIAAQQRVAVHAYCLMTNHIHFLLTPADADGISLTMKLVGSRYAQYINKRYRRTGTLWEGRHRASLVQAEIYLLSCYRYIELNPLRANMVARPEAYRWSSYHANAWGDTHWLTPHAEYLRLGRNRTQRCYAYRELLRYQLSDSDIHQFRQAAYYSHPVGDTHFCRQIADKYGIHFGRRQRGRPRKLTTEVISE